MLVQCRGAGEWCAEHNGHGEVAVKVESGYATMTCPCGDTYQGEAFVSDPEMPN